MNVDFSQHGGTKGVLTKCFVTEPDRLSLAIQFADDVRITLAAKHTMRVMMGTMFDASNSRMWIGLTDRSVNPFTIRLDLQVMGFGNGKVAFDVVATCRRGSGMDFHNTFTADVSIPLDKTVADMFGQIVHALILRVHAQYADSENDLSLRNHAQKRALQKEYAQLIKLFIQYRKEFP
jgi:hypothetical protein